MSYINILIVDDDLHKISTIIQTIKDKYSETLSISQASNVQEAIENLQKKEFHLLITDLLMPLKHDTSPIPKGGEALTKGIYRQKNKVNVPMYIIGLTQYPELQTLFKGGWKVWHYDNTQENWKNNLRDLIFHISLVKSRIVANKIETIFLEGFIDKKVIEETIKLYFPNLEDKIFLDTITYGAGASWVERQLFIWAKSLTKKNNSESYLKAVGIFDDDESGNKSIEKLEELIDKNSAENKTYSVAKYTQKHSVILKSIKLKGITFETTLEEMYTPLVWKIAANNKWLSQRDINTIQIDSNLLNLSQSDLNEENLTTAGFTQEESCIILNKINPSHKVVLCTHLCKLDSQTKKEALLHINFLLKEVFQKLKIAI